MPQGIQLSAAMAQEDFPEVSVASAATCDIGAAASLHVQITGTTTITSFGTAAAGIFRIGRFAAALTLTHNATSLILPGGSSITTAANDRFGALSLGSGNWIVLWYQRASGKAVVAPLVTEITNAARTDAGQTFTGAQTVAVTATGEAARLRTTEDGAVAGPVLVLYRNSASPAANDAIGGVQFNGKDSAGNELQYGSVSGVISSPTDAAETGLIQYTVRTAGALGVEAKIGGGVQLGAPTGGAKGLGSINCKDAYNDDVALTCMAAQREFIEHGTIDLEKWDAMVPDEEIPAVLERRPLTEEIEAIEILPENGGFVRKAVRLKRQKTELMPVFDEDGNGIDAIEVPQYEEIVHPARIERRRHEVAHLFKRMVDDGFDPRDPKSYIARLQRDQALPGMPSEAEWRHNSISVGEMLCRKWLAMEFMALVLMNHEQRIAALEKPKR